jgi:SAM-dependent methyltransferase
MDRSEQRKHHQQNRRSWNAVTEAHNSHKGDQATFLRSGGSTLFPEELELLGELDGKRVVHLQCNCGQDSVSLAALGAHVTGVDISDAAVKFATDLSRETGIPAQFERADLFEWFDAQKDLPARFDTAFASYGTVGWLADIGAWARGAAQVLVPGGRLVLLEFHPLIWSLRPDGGLGDPYFVSQPLFESGVNDYVAETGPTLSPSGWKPGIVNFQNPEASVSFQWTVAEIVQAMVDAGLSLEVMREYPFANGCSVIEGMTPLPGRRYGMPKGQPAMPLMLGLVARKPAV